MTQEQMEGAAREAVVKADLLRRGFEVFQTVCNNSTFDLVAFKHELLIKVEVKGSTRVPKHGPVGATCNKLDCRKFDVLATVDEQRVRYMRSALHRFNPASKELVGEETTSPKMRKDHIARQEAMQKETQ